MKRMNNNTRTLCLIAATGGALVFSPAALAAPPETMNLMGVVRDFRASHSDFGSVASAGHVAGLVDYNLNARGNPSFSGAGQEVIAQWSDADGRMVMPSIEAAPQGGTVTDFEVAGGTIVPGERFAAQVQVIGAAIQTGSYHMPVTVRFHIGDATFNPFGNALSPVDGNVNDNQHVTGWANPGGNPRTFTFPNTFDAGTSISVTGTSWKKKSRYYTGSSNSHWSAFENIASSASTSDMFALRNGDAVPNMAGAYSQSSVEVYLSEYITDGHVVLDANQTIYLFELGRGGDFQDLVVLVSLATETSFFEAPAPDPVPVPEPMCVSTIASAGELGATSDGGIASSGSFSQWFADNPGHNFSIRHAVSMTRDAQGFYEYNTADFTPVDNEGFRNQGDAHNRMFTYEIDAQFTYQECGGQTIEFEGSDDFWIFINGQLALDLGGVEAGASQFLEIDRLGLTDGETYPLKIFYAHRAAASAPFRLRTNVMMSTKANIITTAGSMYD